MATRFVSSQILGASDEPTANVLRVECCFQRYESRRQVRALTSACSTLLSKNLEIEVSRRSNAKVVPALPRRCAVACPAR